MKSDFFPNAMQSDLPIAQLDDKHSSFKQIFLSRFHRRPKFASTNISATFRSSSLNAANVDEKKINLSTSTSSLPSTTHSVDNIKWITNLKHYQFNTITEQQNIAERFRDNEQSFNYICNRTLNHFRQKIYRVRKSRIIVSFDDIQQQRNGREKFQIFKENFQLLLFFWILKIVSVFSFF